MYQGSSILFKTLVRLTDEGQSLHGNSFAKGLCARCKIFSNHVNATDPKVSESEMEASFSQNIEAHIMVMIENPELNSEENVNEEASSRDFRLRDICVRGIRRYPALEDKKEGCDLYYGLSFSDADGNPLSSIFLGHNGVGKTSFYCALEKVGMGFSDTAIQRGYAGDQINFIRNLSAREEDMRIALRSESGTMECGAEKVTDSLAFPAYFCMERDIESISKGLSDLYVARQLGIMEYYILLKVLDRLLESRKGLLAEHEELVLKERHLSAEIWMIGRIHSLEGPEQLQYLNSLTFARDTLSDSGRSIKDKMTLLRHYVERVQEVLRLLLPAEDTSEEPHSRDELLAYMPPGADALAQMEIGEGTEEGVDALKEAEQNDYISKVLAVVNWLVELFRKSVIVKRSGTDVAVSRKYLNNKTEQRKTVEAAIRKLVEDNGLLSLGKDRISEIIRVYDELGKEYREILGRLAESGNKVMKSLFESFYDDDLKEVRFVLSGDSFLRLGVEVTAVRPDNREEVMKAEPRRFLNNFRFKLFCVAVKASMAFGCSVLYGMNFPFVMDDVFNSSDFPNRGKIKQFIMKLYEAYESVLDIPGGLQLIFFTQDDIIGESVASGIRRFGDEDRVKYSRIFSYTEAGDDEMKWFELPEGRKARVQYLEDVIYIR